MTSKRRSRKGSEGSSAISVRMAEAFFRRIREIKSQNPEAAREIDRMEAQIRDRLRDIRKAIDTMTSEEQELVKILVINGLYKSAEEILLDEA